MGQQKKDENSSWGGEAAKAWAEAANWNARGEEAGVLSVGMLSVKSNNKYGANIYQSEQTPATGVQQGPVGSSRHLAFLLFLDLGESWKILRGGPGTAGESGTHLEGTG